MDFFSPSFRPQVEQLDRTNPCIVYCLKGNRGKRAMGLMKSGGFLVVYNISGASRPGKNQAFQLSNDISISLFVAR